MNSQAGHLPPLKSADAGLFNRSERILQEYRRGRDGFSAKDLKDLIQEVLHHPEFNADDVDHDMHKRLMEAVDNGQIEVIDMQQDQDGDQDVRFFKRKVSDVLQELLADERLAGCQHFAFKEYKDARGERILGGHANCSVSFQLAQISVGPGVVPISIVLYIDGTFIKRGIPIKPIYREFIFMYHIMIS